MIIDIAFEKKIINNWEREFLSKVWRKRILSEKQSNKIEELNCDENNLPYTDLYEYWKWHKKTYPWIWEAEKYNL